MNRSLTRTRRQPARRRAQAGITLVETTVVTSVLADIDRIGGAQLRQQHAAPPPRRRRSPAGNRHPLRPIARRGSECAFAHQFRGRRRRQLLRDPHRRTEPMQLRRRWNRHLPGRCRGRTCGPIRARRLGQPEIEFALGTFRPDQGHQFAHRHGPAAGPQRHRHSPGDEHHGASALLLPGAGAQRLSPLLMRGRTRAAGPNDQRR